jgi:hypothetical protein
MQTNQDTFARIARDIGQLGEHLEIYLLGLEGVRINNHLHSTIR